MHRILEPNNAILNTSVNDLNKFFNTMAIQRQKESQIQI